jgi:hypothetical protein
MRLTLSTLITFVCMAAAQRESPEVLRISPTAGPEGTMVEIDGRNLPHPSAVLFGTISATFKTDSASIIALVPHKAITSTITVITPQGRASSPFPFAVINDPRIPEEVSYKSGYVNPLSAPAEFTSAMLWGIAIADTRVPSYESSSVEIAHTQLKCRANGKNYVLNDDDGNVRGGLYRRQPWFGTDLHEPMPIEHDIANHAVILPVGKRPDRVWHFWAASPRAALPSGTLEGCEVTVRARISAGALLQIGMDYWRNTTVGYGPGGNNHEAGASNWYLPSERWQEAVFTDIGGPQF